MSGAFPDDARAFDAWAAAHVDGFRGPSKATKFATGQSNPTYLIEAASGRYVLRRKPLGKLLKSAHMIEREFRVLQGARRHGVPGAAGAGALRGRERHRHGLLLMAMSRADFLESALPSLTTTSGGRFSTR